MTCSDVFQKDLINSVFMIGAIIGSLCNGIMADNFGRMKIITLALVLMGLPGIVSALWVNKWVYILFRILAGIGTLHLKSAKYCDLGPDRLSLLFQKY